MMIIVFGGLLKQHHVTRGNLLLARNRLWKLSACCGPSISRWLETLTVVSKWKDGKIHPGVAQWETNVTGACTTFSNSFAGSYDPIKSFDHRCHRLCAMIFNLQVSVRERDHPTHNLLSYEMHIKLKSTVFVWCNKAQLVLFTFSFTASFALPFNCLNKIKQLLDSNLLIRTRSLHLWTHWKQNFYISVHVHTSHLPKFKKIPWLPAN